MSDTNHITRNPTPSRRHFRNSQIIKAGYKSNRPTLDRLPKLRERPDDAINYTGQRNGKLTALFWNSINGNTGKTFWIVQCDCGRYEYRNPALWAIKPNPDDMCEVCVIQAKRLARNSKNTKGKRLAAWLASMKDLGLTDDEIAQIQDAAAFDTKNKTAAELRRMLQDFASSSGENQQL